MFFLEESIKTKFPLTLSVQLNMIFLLLKISQKQVDYKLKGVNILIKHYGD